MSQVANVLAARGQELLQRWRESVRQHVASGRESPAELEDHIPLFLQQLEAALRGATSTARTSPESSTKKVGREHGAQRFRLGFSLDALVHEYGLLRGLMFELMEETGVQVTLGEVRLLTHCVDAAIAEAVAEHTRQANRLQEQVQRSEAWLSTVLQSIGDAVIVADVEGRAVFLNPVAEALTGWTGNEAQGESLKRVFHLIHERTHAEVDSPVERVLREGRVQGLASPTLLVRKDGAHVPIGDSAAPLRDAAGTTTGVVLVFRDISEKRRQEAERERLLQETERLRALAEGGRARLNALFVQAPVAISVIRDPQLVIEVANPYILRLWGRTAEQVLGRPLLEAMPELEGQPLIDDMRQVVATGKSYVGREVPVHLARAEGGAVETGYFTFVYEALRDERGQPEGVLVVASEVTEAVLSRQKVEALLQRSQQAEQEQARMRHEAERLTEEERKHRDYEQLLIGIVSHDLRNPLGAILLGLQVLLRREGLDARTTQALVRLHTSTERAARMVRDLLDFTQARLGGGLKLERASVDLHAVVRGVVEEFQVTSPERELRLEQRGDGRGRWDADRLAQLAGNLVGNALKYSPADSPVTVRSEGGPEDVRLEVHNQGELIAPEAMARIFQPLQRAVEGTDTAGRSVGLGLYIVEQLVRAHGGDIQVSSTEREGTTFTVRLPRSS